MNGIVVIVLLVFCFYVSVWLLFVVVMLCLVMMW